MLLQKKKKKQTCVVKVIYFYYDKLVEHSSNKMHKHNLEMLNIYIEGFMC